MTVHARFARTARRFPDHPYLHIPARVCGHGGGTAITITYAQAAREIESLAQIYAGGGYGHGHAVALALENRAEFFLHFLALNRLGACVVPLNAEATPAELAHVLGTSGACLAITLPEHAGRLRAALNAGSPACVLLEVTEFAAPPQPAAVARSGNPGDDTPAAIVFTSGTTSGPKGCLLSNEFFRYVGEWYDALGGYCRLRPGVERTITPLPVFHTNALVFSHMAMIETGGCVVQLDRFHPATWWDTVRESRATLMHYLGVMPAMLMSVAPDPMRDRNHGLRFGFGAGVEPAQHSPFEQRFGFPLIEGWAMTETGAAACIMAAHEPRHTGTRCIGRPPAHMQHRVVDEVGCDVPAGAPGEFLVRRSGFDPRRYFYSGYVGDEKATEKAWVNGWFHTGDVVREGEDGSLYFIERRKNIIRRSGENIAAAEVEGVLLRHPAVASCAVGPVHDDVRGEEVAVCIVLKPGEQATPRKAVEIVRHCQVELSYYKVPGWIAFLPALPVTSTQKVQRSALQELIRLELAAGRAHDLRGLKRRDSAPG